MVDHTRQDIYQDHCVRGSDTLPHMIFLTRSHREADVNKMENNAVTLYIKKIKKAMSLNEQFEVFTGADGQMSPSMASLVLLREY